MPPSETKPIKIEQSNPDQFVRDPEVCKEFGVTPMTLARWTNDPELNFPPPVSVRHRNFRSRKLLEEWKAAQLRKAIAAPLKVFAPRRKRERA
jgi:hypothetical protein